MQLFPTGAISAAITHAMSGGQALRVLDGNTVLLFDQDISRLEMTMRLYCRKRFPIRSRGQANQHIEVADAWGARRLIESAQRSGTMLATAC